MIVSLIFIEKIDEGWRELCVRGWVGGKGIEEGKGGSVGDEDVGE